MRKPGSSTLVYSTEGGRICPKCGHPITACHCAALKAAARPGDGIVRVSRETSGRGGKAVTVVRGVPLDAAALGALGQRLRRSCGAGGTVKDGVIEVQGDHAERLVLALQAEGYKVTRVGG